MIGLKQWMYWRENFLENGLNEVTEIDEMRRRGKSNNVENMISHVVEPRAFSSEYPDNDLMVQTSRHLPKDSMNPKAIMQTPKLAPSTKIRLIGTK